MSDLSLTPQADAGASGFGLYVHVPFCERRCPYCDFSIVVTRRPAYDAYVDAVITELSERAAWVEGRALTSLYFGGGTPSLLPPRELERIIEAVDRRWPLGTAREVAMEFNPEHATDERLAALRQVGVRRISFGVQSFDDATLARLGRQHRGDEAIQAVRRATALGFEVSVDLIFGVPGDTHARIDRDLQQVVALRLPHVSVYELTYEPHTSFTRRVRNGEIKPWTDARLAETLERVRTRLQAAGMVRYEVSNYARPGAESQHNLVYWRGQPYLGVGPGAHGFVYRDGRAYRWSNTAHLGRYVRGEREGHEEWVGQREHALELALVGLRVREGIPITRLQALVPGAADALAALAARWVQLGWGTVAVGTFRPNDRGLDMADAMAEHVADVVLGGDA